MRSYQEADIGRTPGLCQDALVEMLEELFRGRTYNGQQGRKPLKVCLSRGLGDVYKRQDVDTDQACAPYVVVQMTGGQIADERSPQIVEFSLVICAYDRGKDRGGWQDVTNIKERIIQRVCTAPYFGGSYTILKPIAWAIQQDDTAPYYYGAVTLNCTAPAMVQDAEMAELI